MTLACLISFATPPTSIPMDSVESMVSAQQTEHRAALHREAQVIDHGFTAIGFSKPFDKNGLAHSAALLTARSSIYPRPPRGSSWMRGFSSSQRYPMFAGSYMSIARCTARMASQ